MQVQKMIKNLIVVCAFVGGVALLNAKAIALDTSVEEAACADIGFKRKTPAFADCVVELMSRQSSSNDPDDATCRKYGFKPKTNEYAVCRQQIEQARADGQRQQAQFDEQKRQYEAQLAEQKKQRDSAKGLALMQLGLGISSGAYNAGNGYGAFPNPPAQAPANRTYVLPGGRMMNCNTVGSVTNCF